MEARNETNQPTFLAKQNLFDGITAAVAVGGAIAGAATNTLAVAAFPLAGAIGLHIFNRRQLMTAMNDHYDTMIRQQNLYIVSHQDSLNTLSDRIQHLQDEVNSRIEIQSLDLRQEIGVKGQEIANLGGIAEQLTRFTETLDASHQQLKEVVGRIQQIENTSHALQVDPASAVMYYQRGLNFHKLGDKQEALIDFNRAIELNPQYAEAYHIRGLLLAELSDRQGAVDDLREAAKFYFESGEIDLYQEAKDLALELYEHETIEQIPARSKDEVNFVDPIGADQVLVGGLFDD